MARSMEMESYIGRGRKQEKGEEIEIKIMIYGDRESEREIYR